MDEEESDSASSELTSDEELQRGLARGTLKPGLIGEVAPRRTFTNNVSGLREKLSALKRKGQTDWLERMDVTCPVATPLALAEVKGESDTEEKTLDPNDDFKREMRFYQQAQAAVVLGLRKLEELEIPTTRPDDYFAEMVKTDNHMRKVRERLLSRQKSLEQREKARKLRELKKFGKKVQQDILQKRREERNNSMKAFKKGRSEKAQLLGGKNREAVREEEEFAVSASKDGIHERTGEKRERKRTLGVKSKKQQYKDRKFGFGGKKRGHKKNTARSSADMSSFRSARHSKPAKMRKKRNRK